MLLISVLRGLRNTFGRSHRILADEFVVIGIKAKVENRGQYDQYLEELKPLREELGVNLKEDLYPEEAK